MGKRFPPQGTGNLFVNVEVVDGVAGKLSATYEDVVGAFWLGGEVVLREFNYSGGELVSIRLGVLDFIKPGEVRFSLSYITGPGSIASYSLYPKTKE